MNFLVKNPDKAYKIAFNIENNKIAANNKLIGKSKIAKEFYNYLMENKNEIPKLLSHVDEVKNNIKIQKRGGAFTKPSLSNVKNNLKAIGNIIEKPIMKTINKVEDFINVDSLHPKAIINAIKHANPHQYSVIRGIASEMVGKPHPLTDYIRNSVGGSFHPQYKPKDLHTEALHDILDSRSPQHLAEMLHDEMMDQKRGMNTGGGLWSSIKHIAKKAVHHGKKYAQKGLSVAKDINSMLNKGLIIAQALEPLVEMYDPSLGDSYSNIVNNIKNVHNTSGRIVQGADIINEIFHGNVEQQIGRIADLTLPKNKATAIKGAVDIIDKARKNELPEIRQNLDSGMLSTQS
jgi:hypothetical protein